MLNGRRIDLEQLAGQARALWLAREDMMTRSRMAELFSHAALLSLFVAIVSAADRLATFNVRELPTILLPFAVIAIASLILRRIDVQVNLQLPSVQLPFDAAPVMRRASLRITECVARLKSMALALPVPHIHLDQHEALQSIALFAQRMSRNWLEVRAALEALMQRTDSVGSWLFLLIESSMSALTLAADALHRQPRVVVLRC